MEQWLAIFLFANCFIQAELQCTFRETTAQSVGDPPSVYYLDRHAPACEPGEVMTEFQFGKKTPTEFRYLIKCCSSGNVKPEWDETCRTDCEVDGEDPGEGGEVKYLDRHKVKCRPGFGLAGFGMKRCMGCDSCKGMYYNIRCMKLISPPIDCSDHNTLCQVQYHVQYLDRHHVKCENDKFLTEFQLANCGTDSIEYRYKCCKHPSTADVCKVVKVTPTTQPTYQDNGEKVVGVATAISCDANQLPRVLSISNEQTEEESVSFETTNSDAYSFSESISIGYTVGGEFAEASASVSLTGSSTTTISNTETRGSTTSTLNQQEFKSKLTPPGAVVVAALARQFEINNAEIPVDLTLECNDGTTRIERTTIKLSSKTFTQVYFQSETGRFTNVTVCKTEMAGTCFKNVMTNNLLASPSTLFTSFGSCFTGKGQLL